MSHFVITTDNPGPKTQNLRLNIQTQDPRPGIQDFRSGTKNPDSGPNIFDQDAGFTLRTVLTSPVQMILSYGEVHCKLILTLAVIF